MIVARLSNLPAPATVARRECTAYWAASTEQKQSTPAEGDFTD